MDGILAELDDVLAARYAEGGPPSIPPERLLRASLLRMVYSVRSEHLLMEQLDYNLLFRWFMGLNVNDPVWDNSTFSFNRERLFDEAIAQRFFEHAVPLARMQDLVSDEHFSVDGTLLEAWAPLTRVFGPETAAMTTATTSTARSAATIRTHPPPTRTRD